MLACDDKISSPIPLCSLDHLGHFGFRFALDGDVVDAGDFIAALQCPFLGSRCFVEYLSPLQS